MITRTDDQSVRVWNLRNGRALHRLVGHTDRVKAVKFGDKYGNTIASGSYDKTVRLWSYSGDKQSYFARANLRGHSSKVSCLAFAGRHLISGGY